jgi:hypothetical protein
MAKAMTILLTQTASVSQTKDNKLKVTTTNAKATVFYESH